LKASKNFPIKSNQKWQVCFENPKNKENNKTIERPLNKTSRKDFKYYINIL
jgi:hypothetical protein